MAFRGDRVASQRDAVAFRGDGVAFWGDRVGLRRSRVVAPAPAQRPQRVLQQEGIGARRTKRLPDAVSKLRNRYPPRKSAHTPAATAASGSEGTAGSGSLGQGGPGQSADRDRDRRRAVRSARAFIPVDASASRTATGGRAQPGAPERAARATAKLAPESCHDHVRRARARNGVAGRAPVRGHRPHEPLTSPSASAVRGGERSAVGRGVASAVGRGAAPAVGRSEP